MSSISPAAAASSLTNAIGSSGNALLHINGLASGLNTDQIIQGLLAFNQAQISDIQQKVTQAQQAQSAYQSLENGLLTLQGDISGLGRSINGIFDGRSVTVSDPSLLDAAADSTAVPGVYRLQVNNLAAAQEVASQSFASANSAIAQGTFQIALGNGTTTTITVDSSNNTLQGLASAINHAAVGVSASIINDGSATAAQPYRLVLTADKTGTANGFTATFQPTNPGDAAQPEFNANYLGPVVLGSNYTGTSTPTSNVGAGNYTGTANDTYTFTVLSGGAVGTDNNLQVGYTDSTGKHTGTLTINAGDVNTPITVADGIQLTFGAGTLVNGQSFSVKATVPTLQSAADASVTLGSGAGALTVTSATNQVNDLIPGVTLKLQRANPAQPVTITVGNDTGSAQKAIDTFVSDYNSLVQSIAQLNTYNAGTGQAGVLFGDSRVAQIRQQITRAVEGAVPGVNPLMNNLGALGITVQQNGQLSVNDSTVASVLAGGVPGVTLGDIKSLFALTGSSTNPGVQFITGGNHTLPSTTPYTVNITRAAEQASVTGATPLAGQITIDSRNDTLALKIDGQLSTITLSDGTYSQQALAQMVEGAINGHIGASGRQVAVALNSGALSITSSTYGASSQVAISSGSANAALGLTDGQGDQGKDVAGSFTVNGVTETATGIGQVLAGNSGNAHTAGLEVNVTLTPAQVGSGTQADLTVTSGIAAQLNGILNTLLDPVTGRLATINNDYNQQITRYQQQITADTNLMQAKQQELEKEFINMEQTLARLQSVSSFLTAQALALPQLNTQGSSSTQSTGAGR
jgi:flagellar hook-associated protein 2